MGRPKTIYEEITRGAAKPSPLPYVLSIGLPAGFLAIFRLICHDSALVNRFVWQVNITSWRRNMKHRIRNPPPGGRL